MQADNEETTMERVNRGLAKRYRRERRFRLFGLGAILASLCFLGLLFVTIGANGWTAFQQTEILLDIHFDRQQFTADNLSNANYPALIKKSMLTM
ncbi:MAG TPA: DUF3333 domain-containing protein, partial [Desulfobulbus sp.]|nr:DUF3333 domain-containing protein [Desulfobulbus sp.]